MKFTYRNIIIVLVVLAAIIVAGCTSSSPSGTVTATPTTGPLTISTLVDMSKVQWYSYNITEMISGVAGMSSVNESLRVDLGVVYNDTKANKFNESLNMIYENNSTTSVSEIYMDPVTGDILGGYSIATVNGNVTRQNISAMKIGQGYQDPIMISKNSTLTNAGSEAVTVPAGTFTSKKYTWTGTGTTGIVWIAPNVPVPVEIQYASQGAGMEMDLTGWG